MLGLEDFLEAIEDELGDAYELIRDEQLIRWINRGRARLGVFQRKSATLTWADAASSVDLPTDFAQLDRILPVAGSRTIPPHTVLSSTIAFLDPSVVMAGSATLIYGARYADVTGSTVSAMPALADEAAISFALSRFFQRLAANRADFRRYVAITGQNGVDVQELVDLAAQHEREFEDARIELLAPAPASFYGD